MRTYLLAGIALLAAVVGWKAIGTGGADATATPPVAVSGAGGGARAELFVHVSGEVRRPGLYRLRPGARVGDAVERAGGPTRRAELGGVNLAARVQDGRQVDVPRRGERAGAAGTEPEAAAAGPASASGAAGQISLATATAEQLDTLEGIGPTLARRIVEYREANGGFGSIEELRNVDGIGEKRFESLREGLAP